MILFTDVNVTFSIFVICSFSENNVIVIWVLVKDMLFMVLTMSVIVKKFLNLQVIISAIF